MRKKNNDKKKENQQELIHILFGLTPWGTTKSLARSTWANLRILSMLRRLSVLGSRSLARLTGWAYSKVSGFIWPRHKLVQYHAMWGGLKTWWHGYECNLILALKLFLTETSGTYKFIISVTHHHQCYWLWKLIFNCVCTQSQCNI